MFEDLIPGIRALTADDLDIGILATAASTHSSSSPDAPAVPADHILVKEISRLARLSGGVILSGPPGTSKSFFAAAAAQHLVGGAREQYRFVQFHASYQYEDFMLGFRPKDAGGFTYKDGPFLGLVRAAAADPAHTYVLVIDELSRADVGRVFGEALTYVERSKRELPFLIASGEEIRVPSNFLIIATMNPFDRGVDEVDAAFERRFAKITMDPQREMLEEILTDNAMDEALKTRVLAWFSRINGYAKKIPAASVGHAYFYTATDEASLRDIWDYQLQYLVQRAFRRDENTQASIESSWQSIFLGSELETTPGVEPANQTPDDQP